MDSTNPKDLTRSSLIKKHNKLAEFYRELATAAIASNDGTVRKLAEAQAKAQNTTFQPLIIACGTSELPQAKQQPTEPPEGEITVPPQHEPKK
jgi:hypothetical protein